MQAVNSLLEDVRAPVEDEGEWGGFEDELVVEAVDHEEEYVDEDRYTTVTVEAVDVSKEGLQKIVDEEESEDTLETEKPAEKGEDGKKKWPKKPPKKKFRYESKAERKVTRGKQKAGNKARADARRGTD